MKNPAKFLTLLLTRFDWAIRQPAYARAVVLAHKYFKDGFIAELVRAVALHGGNWRAAVRWLELRGCDSPARLKDFAKWAASVTAPARRGLLLLEWKGGAL